MLAIADQIDLDRGSRTKPGGERMCAVTRQVVPVAQLIRFVVAPTGEIVPDLKRNLPGRGLWVTSSRDSVTEATRRNVFARGFKRDVKVPPALADDIDRMMVRSIVDALAMAAKAGQAVSGFAKVEEAIGALQAVALFHAADGAADGIRKLNGRLAAALREIGGNAGDFPVIDALTSDELDLALGRANVIHAALLAGPASKTLLTRCQTLARFRTAGGGSDGDRGKERTSE